MNFDNDLFALIPLAAIIVDALLGDPRSSLHPVVLIGKLISFYENIFYKKNAGTKSLLWRGLLVVLLVFITVGAITALLLYAAKEISPYLYWTLSIFILYFTITPRALTRDGWSIYSLLKSQNLVMARKRLSWIVGRDTDQLDENDITRGTVETIAENTTDGIISPLFFFLLFGPVGAMIYRAGNTMDSMLGYKDEHYLYFGRCAARFDDVLNWIPARITFVLFVLSAFILHLDWKNAIKICKRDASKHPSPNGGWAEATIAGAMHVQLGGYNYYEGKPEFREYMGDKDRLLVGADILSAIKMMYAATILFALAESAILLYHHSFLFVSFM